MLLKILPWLMSAITIYTMWAAGEKRRGTWLIGLANQVLWVIFIVNTKAWGLLPMTGAIVIVYVRNHIKWSRSN